MFTKFKKGFTYPWSAHSVKKSHSTERKYLALTLIQYFETLNTKKKLDEHIG